MSDAARHIGRMRLLWNLLSLKSGFGYISHLQRGEGWDPAEFHLSGVRFVDRMIERFQDYGTVAVDHASILEIGCGVGRFMKPLACRFRSVCGFDISSVMLLRAKWYCRGIPNIRYELNDGASLASAGDGTFDYCVSAGVFQHITDINIVLAYIREALRILKPGGLFLFQFEGNRTEAVGKAQRGAKITARLLDNGLADTRFVIRELSLDPADAVQNVVAVIQKCKPGEEPPPETRSFQAFKMTQRRWISGVYDNIKTRTHMHARQQQAPLRLTFYDD